MQCRTGCGACCIASSINTAFYGMPEGKPAGVPCVHLSEQRTCLIFGDARRPVACAQFTPEPSVCGDDAAQALALLTALERDTLPLSELVGMSLD